MMGLSSFWQRRKLDRRIAMRTALSKATQLDLELLLETYAVVQQESRDRTRQQIETFEITVRGW